MSNNEYNTYGRGDISTQHKSNTHLSPIYYTTRHIPNQRASLPPLSPSLPKTRKSDKLPGINRGLKVESVIFPEIRKGKVKRHSLPTSSRNISIHRVVSPNFDNKSKIRRDSEISEGEVHGAEIRSEALSVCSSIKSLKHHLSVNQPKYSIRNLGVIPEPTMEGKITEINAGRRLRGVLRRMNSYDENSTNTVNMNIPQQLPKRRFSFSRKSKKFKKLVFTKGAICIKEDLVDNIHTTQNEGEKENIPSIEPTTMKKSPQKDEIISRISEEINGFTITVNEVLHRKSASVVESEQRKFNYNYLVPPEWIRRRNKRTIDFIYD